MKNVESRNKCGIGRFLCSLLCALLMCSVAPCAVLAQSDDGDTPAGQAAPQEQATQPMESQVGADGAGLDAGAEGPAEELPAQPEAVPSPQAAPQEQATQPMESQSEAGTAEEAADAEKPVEGLTAQSESMPSQQLTTQDWGVNDEGRIEFNKNWSKRGVRAYSDALAVFSFSVASDGRAIIDLQNTTKGRISWRLVDGTSDLGAAAEYFSDTIRANENYEFDHFLKAGDYRLVLWGKDNNVETYFNITYASLQSISYPVRDASGTSNPVGTLRMKSWDGGTFLTYGGNRRMDYWRIQVPYKTNGLQVKCECMDDKFRVVNSVSVLDARGKILETLSMSNMPSKTWDTESLDAGTYFLCVESPANSSNSDEGSYRIRWDASSVTPSVQYYVHRQTYGNESVWSKRDGATSGTVGQGKRLEAIWIRLRNTPFTGGIQYRTHVQKIGWQGWRSNGAMSGTRGKSYRLEAIQIKLTGQMAQKYDVYYRVHAQKLGWMGWAKNGASAGTAGLSYRLEAIQIKIVPKGSTAGVGKSAMTSYAAKTASTFSTDDFTVTFPKFLRKKFYLGLIRRTGGEVLWHFSTNVRKNSYLVYGGTLIVRSKNSPTRQYHYGYSKRGYSVDVGYGAQGLEDIFPSRYRKGSAKVSLR